MKLSIAIPTYECHGRGVEFIDYSFRKLAAQTFKDFQIVITDDSVNDDIKWFCEENPYQLNIKYVKNETKSTNFSQNTNKAIQLSDGEIIKILYQDDFIYDDSSLEKIVNAFGDDVNWLVSSCMHTHDDGNSIVRRHYPRYNQHIHYGDNTIGCPSVLAIRKHNNQPLFDERLIWLMDVDFYKNLYDRFGQPKVLNEVTTVVRIWSHQLSQTMPQNVKDREYAIVRGKYNEGA